MVNYSVALTLLDRTQTNVTASAKLQVTVNGTTVGDLKSWMIRLSLTNSGVGKINNGNIKLRID